jgi:hypothetical protein
VERNADPEDLREAEVLGVGIADRGGAAATATAARMCAGATTVLE